MYCLKGRRVTETENITTAAYQNGRLMRRGQCITCGKKLRPHLLKKELLVEVFLTLNSHSKCILPGHSFTCPGTKLYKSLNPMERQRSGVYR